MNFAPSWAANLPSDWSVKPLKAIAEYFVSSVDKVPADDEEPVRLCNYSDVYNNEFITPDLDLMQTTATPQEIAKFKLNVDDVVITKDSEDCRDIAVPALVTETAPDLVCGYHLAILRPKGSELSGRFLFRCLQSRQVRLPLELASTGVTRFGLPKDEIGILKLPVPPASRQKQIAAYLDAETARIDALIAEKQRMLALLDEKRQALISQAVTQGLNPDAPMKPSGQEWLGNVPAHWELHRLKFLLSEPLAYGANESALDDDPTHPRFVRITDVDVDGSLREDTFKSLPPEVAEPFLLQEGDVLLARSGATVGKSFLYASSWGIAAHAGYLIRARCNQAKLLSTYLYHFSRSRFYWAQVDAIRIQSTIENFSAEKYANLLIPLPPKPEQFAIIEALSSSERAVRQVHEELRASISLLDERRKAVVTSGVTGALPIEGTPHEG